MPIYEYKCPDCGETFEALQSINDEPLDECKLCGGKSVKKIMSKSNWKMAVHWWDDSYTPTGTPAQNNRNRNTIEEFEDA